MILVRSRFTSFQRDRSYLIKSSTYNRKQYIYHGYLHIWSPIALKIIFLLKFVYHSWLLLHFTRMLLEICSFILACAIVLIFFLLILNTSWATFSTLTTCFILFEGRIKNPVKYLRWSFSQKQLTVLSCQLFSQKAPFWKLILSLLNYHHHHYYWSLFQFGTK